MAIKISVNPAMARKARSMPQSGIKIIKISTMETAEKIILIVQPDFFRLKIDF